MAPHSSTLAWKIPWTEEPGRLQSMGHEESDMTEHLQFHFSLSCIGEGNGNPLQCSCLENPRDRGAWWAAIYGVAHSQTWLKQLSSSSNGRKQRETKEPLNEGERGEWKSGLRTQHSKNEAHSIQSHHSMANRWGKSGNSDRLYILGLQKPPWLVTAATIVKYACSLEENCDKLRHHIKKKRHHFGTKVPYSESNGFSSSHVWMWQLDNTEGWALKNWCFQLCWRVPWTARRSNKSILKETNPNIYWRDRSETEIQILWPCDVKRRLTGKGLDAGKDWGQAEKVAPEDEKFR